MKLKILMTFLLLCSWKLYLLSSDWEWGVSAGGSGWDAGNSIVVDSAGNSYVTGYFSGIADFGDITLESSGEQDLFVGKIDSNGNWVWVESAGGDEKSSGKGVALDSTNNVYITGFFSGTAEFGDISLTSAGYRDMFVASLDQEGEWLWVERGGGSSNDYGFSIVIDSNDHPVVTGRFYDDADFGNIELSSNGSADLFIAKLNNYGDWLWVEQAGGDSYIEGLSLVADSNNDIIVTGCFLDTAQFGAISLTSNEWDDIFVAKLDETGSWLWAVRAGGEVYDIGHSVITDSEDNIYVTGEFRGSADFGDTILESGNSYLSDLFVARLDVTGEWLWAIKAGGTSSAVAKSLAPGVDGQIMIGGYFWNDIQFSDLWLTGSGGFIAGIDITGNWLWVEKAGELNSAYCYALAVGEDNRVLSSGIFSGHAQFGNCYLTGTGLTDIFVASLHYTLDTEGDLLVSPEKFYSRNYPNPFNPETTILFNLPQAGEVELVIYNIRGQRVSTLLNEYQQSGENRIVWDGRDESGRPVSSGVYFYRIIFDGESESGKMMLLQ